MGKKPSTSTLTKEEEAKLVHIWQNRRGMSKRALAARDKLLESQTGWLYLQTIKFCNAYRCDDELDMYINEAYLHLINVLDKFDPAQSRLTTYFGAGLWRRLYAVRNKNWLITLPYAYNDNWLNGKYKEQAEMAKAAGSLDTWGNSPSNRRDTQYRFIYESDPAFEQEKELLRQETIERVRKVVEALASQAPERNLDILKRRMEGQTLEQVGQVHNITRERVRQIADKMKKKFKKEWLERYGDPYE